MNGYVPGNLEQAIRLTLPLIERAKQVLERCARTDEPFVSVFLLFTKDRGVDMEGFLWDSDADKDAARLRMALLAIAAQPFGLWGVLFISDVRWWQSNPEDAAEFKQQMEAGTFDYDEFKAKSKPNEALFARLETYLGDHTATLTYHRDGNQIVWDTATKAPVTHAQVDGRFANLLPPLPMSAGQA